LYPDCVPWLLVKLTAASEDASILADALETCGAAAVTIESATDEQRLQNAFEDAALWASNRITGLFPERTNLNELRTALRQTLGNDPGSFVVEQLPDADWGRAWMNHYRPVKITSRLWICPSWCQPADPNAINLQLDPGLAFGTGTHPTTALCLRWLERHCSDSRTLIDYGCGSGILSIAALKFGITNAVGVDVDPQALRVSRENAARNDVAERYRCCLPRELGDDTRADIVIANILADTLVELAPQLTHRVNTNGLLALSGILTEQAADVRDRYASDFQLVSEAEDGWVLLAGEKLS
jgi:ribosomal protein L11 methyltransferase